MNKDIYSMVPVNKTASVCTSQANCSDTIYISKLESKRILGLRIYNKTKEINELYKELGNKNIVNDKNYLIIKQNDKYNELIQKRIELQSMQSELNKLKEDIKRLEPNVFLLLVIKKLKQEYPDVFYDIQSKILLENEDKLKEVQWKAEDEK